jgi:N-acetylglutamate synthase-like GNAT family acetyltransferase
LRIGNEWRAVHRPLKRLTTIVAQARAEPSMIRKCIQSDVAAIFAIINEAAEAYKGVIPDDRWREPYMPRVELEGEMADGVEFWGCEENGVLVGVMGIQDKGDVCLIRHAYVRPGRQKGGIGTRLLRHLESATEKPILIGTWASATWAIAFYQRSGYRLLGDAEKNALLRTYWRIPERQVETSVVLVDKKWSVA